MAGPHIVSPASPGDEPPPYPEWGGQPLVIEGEVALVVLAPDPSPAGGFPEPVIAAARGGGATFLVRPDRIAAFLLAHAGVELVCERAGLLHGILEGHFERAGDREALLCLWGFSWEGRLLDVILMDQLLDMALRGAEKNPCRFDEIVRSRRVPFEEVARAQTSGSTSEGSPAGGLVALLERDAIARVEALAAVYQCLRASTDKIKEEHGGDDPIGDFGPLGLGIQVGGSIALERMTRRGGLRVEAARDLIEVCEEAFRDSSLRLQRDHGAKKCFEWGDKTILVDDQGRPRVKKRQLEDWLAACVDAVQPVHGLRLSPPRLASERVASTSNLWGELAPYHPGLAAWERLDTAAVSLRVLREAQMARSGLVRPAYEALPRIRSAKPNLVSLRQLSSGPIFSAPENSSLLIVELCDLELRCLADRFSEAPNVGSTLAETLLEGRDPSRYAAPPCTAATSIERTHNLRVASTSWSGMTRSFFRPG